MVCIIIATKGRNRDCNLASLVKLLLKSKLVFAGPYFKLSLNMNNGKPEEKALGFEGGGSTIEAKI